MSGYKGPFAPAAAITDAMVNSMRNPTITGSRAFFDREDRLVVLVLEAAGLPAWPTVLRDSSTNQDDEQLFQSFRAATLAELRSHIAHGWNLPSIGGDTWSERIDPSMKPTITCCWGPTWLGHDKAMLPIALMSRELLEETMIYVERQIIAAQDHRAALAMGLFGDDTERFWGMWGNEFQVELRRRATYGEPEDPIAPRQFHEYWLGRRSVDVPTRY